MAAEDRLRNSFVCSAFAGIDRIGLCCRLFVTRSSVIVEISESSDRSCTDTFLTATDFAAGESDCSAVRACRYVREKVGLDDGAAEQQDEEAEDDKQDYLAIKWDEEATLDLLNSMSLLGNLGEETVGICAQLSSDIGRLHEAVQKLGFDVDDADREVSKAQHDFPVVAAVATGDYHLKILLAQLDQLSASLAAESNVRSVG